MAGGTKQPWTLVLYNHLGKQLGGIDNAHERTFTFQFNAPQTITFVLDTSNAAVKRILEHREEALYVALLCFNVLVMTTEITGLNLVGSTDTKSLMVTCTETMWTRLMPRLVGKSLAGYEVAAATDKLTIIKTLVEALNAESAGNFSTGITPANKTLGVTTTYPKVNYKPFREIIEELAFTSSGFDFWQVSTMNGSPGEYSNNVTGVLEYSTLKGKNRSVEGGLSSGEMVVFEYGYGTRSNVQTYGYSSDYTLLANSVYAIPSGFPTSNYGAGVNSSNVASEKLFGYRDMVSSANISTKTLAEILVEDTINITRLPRQQFVFQPMPKGTPGVPEFRAAAALSTGSYEVGDIVTARVKDSGVTLLNAQVRVYANTIVLDDSGGQTETLVLTQGAE
jgi:hypothetical protein